MTRSRLLCGLSALGLLVGLVAIAPGAGAAADPAYLPPLSAGCARFVAASDHTLAAADVTIDEAEFKYGEALTFLATSDAATNVVVDVRRDGNHWGYFYGTVGNPIAFPVLLPGYYRFRLLSDVPGAIISWHLDCGIAPVAGGGFSPFGPYVRNQAATFKASCYERSYDLASCAVNGVDLGTQCGLDGCSVPLDTSTPGDHTLVLTATDTHGLVTTTTSHYQVVKQPQTITFTSAAPTDAIWNRTANLGDYVPTATSTSGLPVRFSVDPSNTACGGFPGVIGDPTSEAEGRITVRWGRPGICTVYADQPGDDEFAPAQRVVQSFEIHKEPVELTASVTGTGVMGLTPSTFRAELRHEVRFGPGRLTVGYGGQTITFSVAGKVMCVATTVMTGGLFDSTAVATCKAPIGVANAFGTRTYTAAYSGNEFSLSATATGRIKPTL